jgi:hypothetical protein
VGLVKAIFRGTVGVWKRRFVRLIANLPDPSIEVYRWIKNKKGEAAPGPLLYKIPLSSIDFAERQHTEEHETFVFDAVRSHVAGNEITERHVFGNIILRLFSHSSTTFRGADVAFCRYELRDNWKEVIETILCERERQVLFAGGQFPDLPPVPERPRDDVPRFINSFLSGMKPMEDKVEECEQNPKQELRVSPLRFDVVFLVDPDNRKKFQVECSTLKTLTLVKFGEFLVNSIQEDLAHPDIYFVEPENANDAASLGLYINEDGCFEVRTLGDSKTFRIWLQGCFGAIKVQKDTREVGSWASWIGSRSVMKLKANDANFPLTECNDDVEEIVADASADPEPPSRAWRLEQIDWRRFSCSAMVEYNEINAPPTVASTFAERLLQFDIEEYRQVLYIATVPPRRVVHLRLCLKDITVVTGFSEIYASTGFTLHCFDLGLEVHIIPQAPDARDVLIEILKNCDRVLAQSRSREEVNESFLCYTSDRFISMYCKVCGQHSIKNPLCHVSHQLHAAYLQGLIESASDRHLNENSVMQFFPPRKVVHREIDEVIAAAKAAAEESLDIVRAIRDMSSRQVRMDATASSASDAPIKAEKTPVACEPDPSDLTSRSASSKDPLEETLGVAPDATLVSPSASEVTDTDSSVSEIIKES